MKVLHRDNLPVNAPFSATVAIQVAMDFYDWPGVVRGIAYTILVLGWLGVFIRAWKSDETRLWP